MARVRIQIYYALIINTNLKFTKQPYITRNICSHTPTHTHTEREREREREMIKQQKREP